MQSKDNILVAPLNWGLGHASRCIPIINKLLEQQFNPIIASDGDALLLLKKEFPQLKTIELPSYQIAYPKNGKWLKWKLLLNVPHLFRAVQSEKRMTQQIVEAEDIKGIISDSRFGVLSAKVPSVIISHQLNVLSGISTFLTTKIHQNILKKFNECWIPDEPSSLYSGALTKSTKLKNSKFIGVLSRFSKLKVPIKYDLLVVLSGVEPSRRLLEEKLLIELAGFKGKILFVQGRINGEQKIEVKGQMTICNYLLANELEKAFNESELVLTRSGYSTIMDLSVLEKKVFFIPTTGQYEQEYLAKYLEALGIAPFAIESEFKIEMLKENSRYSGFKKENKTQLQNDLFHLF